MCRKEVVTARLMPLGRGREETRAKCKGWLLLDTDRLVHRKGRGGKVPHTDSVRLIVLGFLGVLSSLSLFAQGSKNKVINREPEG